MGLGVIAILSQIAARLGGFFVGFVGFFFPQLTKCPSATFVLYLQPIGLRLSFKKKKKKNGGKAVVAFI